MNEYRAFSNACHLTEAKTVPQGLKPGLVSMLYGPTKSRALIQS